MKISRFVKFPTDAGNVVDNKFSCRASSTKRLRFPIASGIKPVSWQLLGKEPLERSIDSGIEDVAHEH